MLLYPGCNLLKMPREDETVNHVQTAEEKIRHLFRGQFISQVGENIARVALLFYIYQATHSVSTVAITGILQNFPSLLLSPITGALYDHHDKKKVLLIIDLCRTLLSFVAPVLFLFHDLTIPVLMVIVFLTTICSGAFGPGLYALIPSLLENGSSKDILKANATLQTTGNAGLLIGPVLGGALLSVMAAPFVMGIASLSFFFSVVFLWKIQSTEKINVREKSEEKPTLGSHLGGKGVMAILETPALKKAIITYSVFGLLTIPLTLLLPELVKDILRKGGMTLGILVTGFGIGQLAMSILMSKGIFGAQKANTAPMALLGSSIFIVFLGKSTTIPEAFFCALVVGGLLAVIHPIVHADVSIHAPKAVLGSVMTLISAGFLLFASIGAALLPLLTHSIGLSKTFALLGVLSLIMGIILKTPVNRSLRSSPPEKDFV